MSMKIVECPRDAIQGIKEFIPTSKKVEYLQNLLSIGFDTLDFGSFVSPKAIPQMADTAEVIEQLDLSQTKTKLLAIIANYRGAQDASKFSQISYLGFPFSISETFQKSNTNKTILEAYESVKRIQELCQSEHKKLVIYISMGFGNPYGDPYDPDIVAEWIEKLSKLDIHIFSVADTLGMADAEDIDQVFKYAQTEFSNLEVGAHFHSTPTEQLVKIDRAYQSGCRRFDSALLGLGGCPLSGKDLVGNIDTAMLISYGQEQNEEFSLNLDNWEACIKQAQELKSYK